MCDLICTYTYMYKHAQPSNILYDIHMYTCICAHTFIHYLLGAGDVPEALLKLVHVGELARLDEVQQGPQLRGVVLI